MDEIMTKALESGIWAALFCFLFVYMLKDAKARESKYAATIEALTERLKDVAKTLDICEQVRELCEDNAHSATAIKEDTSLIRAEISKERRQL